MRGEGRAVTAAPDQRASAAGPLLASKLAVPSLPAWIVARPRIGNRIAEGALQRLTVITGPPGAGKTIAAAGWASERRRTNPVVWVSLDEYDNRPRVFWSYVLEALRSSVEIPAAVRVPRRWDGGDHQFLIGLASTLATADPPVVVVLDDFHLLTDPALLESIGYVLTQSGPGLRLVVTSRLDPLLPLHRYRLTGELTEIRGDDLAFTTTEAGVLMAQHSVQLPPTSLATLTRRTEGWAAGLRLAAISLDGRDDPGQFVDRFAGDDRAVTSYLVGEVLDKQSEDVRDLLLRTSIVDTVNADLAAELAHENAAAVLPNVAQANAFVQPVGDGWYRYHRLFADVLRLKLRHERPTQVAGLHRLAAAWYHRNGRIPDAVRHWGFAGDWQRAAEIIVGELAVADIVLTRPEEWLAGVLQRMPRRAGWTTPEPLLIAAAVALAEGDDGRCESSLAAADDLLDAGSGEVPPTTRLVAAMIHLVLSRRVGDMAAAATATADCERLLVRIPRELLDRHPGIGASVTVGRLVVEVWAGHEDTASRALDAALAATAAPAAEFQRADYLGYRALLEGLFGRTGRAVQMADEAFRTLGAEAATPGAPTAPAADIAQAAAYLERGELHQVRGELKRADDALRVRPDRFVAAVAYLVAARTALAEYRLDPAAEMVSRGRSGWVPPDWLDRRFAFVESQILAAHGDAGGALEMAYRVGGTGSLEGSVAVAQAETSAGALDKASATLEAALAAFADAPLDAQVGARLLDARLSYLRDEPERGRRKLERAARLAERDQRRLPFVMQRAWLIPLLRHDPELLHSYRQLLELLAPRPVPAQRTSPDDAGPVIIESISEREREVLRHVSGLLSTRQIAAEMYVSVNTVKTHLKNICRKLAVNGRGDAVRRARQLDLL